MTDLERYCKDVALHAGRIGMVGWNDEPVTFKSGIKSHVYVLGRDELTSDADALFATGMAIADAAFMHMPIENLTERKKLVMIGIPTAGTPLAVAASLAWHSIIGDTRIGSRTMRTEKKGHGVHHRWVDGRPRDDEIYYSVDNVITDGQSKIEAIERLQEDGYPVEKMAHIILIDRKQGGVEKLRQQGLTVITLLELPAIVEMLVARGTWPQERLELYRAEMSAYQQ